MRNIRKLKFTDLGLASKIIKKLELRIDNTSNGSIEQMGASLFLVLLEKYNLVENDVAKFMSNLIEDMTEEEFLNLDLEEVFNYISELKKDEGLSRFLLMLTNFQKTSAQKQEFTN